MSTVVLSCLDFSDALKSLKLGQRIARQGWNGADMWLSVSNLQTSIVAAENFWSPHNAKYAEQRGGSAAVPPCITMKNAQGEIQMGWLPSQQDLFARDWVVLADEE